MSIVEERPPAHRTYLRQVSRFVGAGAVATLIYFIVANLIILTVDIRPEIGSLIGYAVAMVFSFFAQGLFTFEKERLKLAQFNSFLCLSAIGLLLSFASVYAAVELLGIHPFWGTAFTSILFPPISFVIMKVWVFR